MELRYLVILLSQKFLGSTPLFEHYVCLLY